MIEDGGDRVTTGDAATRLDDTEAEHVPGDRSGRRNRHNTAAKVVFLLEALATREEGIGVRELARELGIDKSAISRLSEQLVELGAAQQDEFSGRFRVGPRLFGLAATIHGRDTLWRAAEPIVRSLATTFNETCYLAVRDGDEIIFRNKVDCTHKVRYVIDPGERAPLHAGAGGRAVLIGLDDREVREIIDRTGLEAVTSRTITDADRLLALVAADRERHYAASRGERVPSGGAIAAPYFDASGRCLGSVVFTCPDQRYDPAREPEIAATVMRAGSDLSRRLGYHAPAEAQ
ncbi:IclR family transcriptional regulator [Nonomuraea cypriaca]|uniref:IclR family transcriptional regulator n=1 Tax=Nonomuraea cypriaca TaxID=1187855 RepID=UPI0018A85994|nr:IclR family transcriptional regulator [Nonomuraea cypriaca]